MKKYFNYVVQNFNGKIEILLGGRAYPLSCGASDYLDVYREERKVYVLCRNFGLGYIGLEVINLENHTQKDVFIQSQDEVREVLGKKGIDSAPYNIIKTLINSGYID
jgi:hypothetical protein